MKKHVTLFVTSFIMLLTLSVFAQERSVNGKVSDEDGNPVPGVNVVVKGSSTGAVTDIDGNYKLNVPNESSLVFSFIGYETQTILVGNQSVINVTLKPDVVSLSEVVVTAFGISREKKALGYSVEQVSSDEITSSGQTNIVNALQGRVAGVTIRNSSGTPGSGADIIIRGISSLDPGRSNRPLYVIDGIEMSDDVDALPILPSAGSNATSSMSQASVSNRAIDIDPDDIESMTILKGAQATALYGIRAANGAIIITTKKGQKGAPQVDLYYSGGWSNVNKTPTVQRSYIDGRFNTYVKRDGYVWDTWGAPVYSGEPDPTHDIYKEFFVKGTEQGFGGSVAGANDIFNYRFSIDRFYQTGVIPNTDWGKTNFSLSTGVKIGKKLEANATLKYANTGGNKPHVGDKSILSDLSYVSPVADVTHYDVPYTYNGNAFAGIIDHPLYLADVNSYVDNVNRYISGIGLKYSLNDHISINYKLGSDIYSDLRTRIVNAETDEGSKVHGFVIEQSNNSSSVTSNIFAQLNYNLPGEISLTGVVGQYTYISNKKYISTRGEDLVLDDFYNLNNTVNLFQDNSDIKYRNAAVYGELTAGYKNYLFLTVTGRNDWSSTLPKQNNSYFFPSVSVSWVASDMFKLPEFITFAKIRSSYAVIGKDASPYKTGRYFEKAANFPFGDALGFKQSTLIGDENLKPEFTKTFEVGTDLRFMNNRVGIDFTYYKNNLTDMILSVPISNATGAARFVTNAGSMTNYGIEITATGTPIKVNDFNWNVNLNWTKQQGKVVDISEGIEDIELYSAFGITNKYVIDGKIGDLYGYKYMRAPDGQLLIDSNGFPEVNWDSLQLAGNAFPDWTAGMTNTFSYKGIELSVLLEWKQGGKAIDMGRRNSMRNGQLKETERRFEEVVFNGVVLNADSTYSPNTTPVQITPAFYRSTTYYNYAAEVLLEDASWFRIRNISLAYSLPASLFSKIFIKSAKVSFTANNVFLNTPFKGYDPETNYFGSGSNIYGYTGLKTPATRSYSFRLNIGF
ncbi:MAG: SusC/RagA family TonB-linked outer membrane protein [Cyclobacteriaceae bacterium]|nr:SusC/RagA family TonB-linked outer membrane protein [Cyclobacteriaceae bacterium]